MASKAQPRGQQGQRRRLRAECGEFRGLSVTQRRKGIKEWDRCECCLTDCRDKKTGIRCYRRIGFRRHHLLRLVSQTRANPVRNGGRRQQQPQGEVNGAGRNTPHGKPGQANGGRSCGQGTPPQRQADASSHGASLRWARIENWYGSEPPGVSTWA